MLLLLSSEIVVVFGLLRLVLLVGELRVVEKDLMFLVLRLLIS